MSMGSEELIRILHQDELQYPYVASALGPEAVRTLEEVVSGDDAVLAARAAALGGYLTADSARTVLQRAVVHHDPVVRVAAAASLERQPSLASGIMRDLLRDSDPGVRKWALRSLRVLRPSGYRDQVKDLAAAEQIPFLRDLAHEVAQQLPS